VWSKNKAPPFGAVKINLKGIGIGNGLTEPSIQYRYYAQVGASWPFLDIKKI
jgi:carboxypeptidase C (cathepsin A)